MLKNYWFFKFVLGGNWDYDRGSFDRYLDESRTVWLRIPFHMTQGELDSEVIDSGARIQFEKPVVLKHLYKEGLDGAARINTYGALLNQFQEPTDRDADVEQHWIAQGKNILSEVERLFS